MITSHTCGSLSKIKIFKDAIGMEYNTKKKFCVMQKKILSFGPNRIVEVRPNETFGQSLQETGFTRKIDFEDIDI
jgi:hypothetical protein